MTGKLTRPVSPGAEAVYWAAALLPAAALWFLPAVPSQDGPTHLYQAWLATNWEELSKGPHGRFFLPNEGFLPTIPFHRLLAALLWFLSPESAEKLVLSTGLLGFAASVRAFGKVASGSVAGAALALPLVHSQFIAMGFFGFVWGAAVFPAFLALWWWGRGDARPRHAAALGAGGVFVWALHPVAFVASAVAVVALEATRVAVHFREPERRAVALRGALVRSAAGLGPGTVATLVFAAGSGGEFLHRGLRRLALMALRFEPLHGLDPLERPLAVSVAFATAALVAWRLTARIRARDWREPDLFLAPAVVLGLLWLASPDRIGLGAFISLRLLYLTAIALVLWLATLRWDGGAHAGVLGLAVTLSLALSAVRINALRTCAREIAADRAFLSHVQSGQTILSLDYSRLENPKFPAPARPTLHATARLALAKRLVDLNNYQAWSGFFAFRYRSETDPNRHLSSVHGGIEKSPLVADPAAYENTTGLRIDWIVVRAWQDRFAETPEGARVREQLAERYEEAARSGTGATLYRRRPG